MHAREIPLLVRRKISSTTPKIKMSATGFKIRILRWLALRRLPAHLPKRVLQTAVKTRLCHAQRSVGKRDHMITTRRAFSSTSTNLWIRSALILDRLTRRALLLSARDVRAIGIIHYGQHNQEALKKSPTIHFTIAWTKHGHLRL